MQLYSLKLLPLTGLGEDAVTRKCIEHRPQRYYISCKVNVTRNVTQYPLHHVTCSSTKILSMIRKYHNPKLQTNPWHHKKEPHNNHETKFHEVKAANDIFTRNLTDRQRDGRRTDFGTKKYTHFLKKKRV